MAQQRLRVEAAALIYRCFMCGAPASYKAEARSVPHVEAGYDTYYLCAEHAANDVHAVDHPRRLVMLRDVRTAIDRIDRDQRKHDRDDLRRAQSTIDDFL